MHEKKNSATGIIVGIVVTAIVLIAVYFIFISPSHSSSVEKARAEGLEQGKKDYESTIGVKKDSTIKSLATENTLLREKLKQPKRVMVYTYDQNFDRSGSREEKEK